MYIITQPYYCWCAFFHCRHLVFGETGQPEVVEPDIFTLGKALGGGLPAAAMFAKPDIAKLLVPGTEF